MLLSRLDTLSQSKHLCKNVFQTWEEKKSDTQQNRLRISVYDLVASRGDTADCKSIDFQHVMSVILMQ